LMKKNEWIMYRNIGSYASELACEFNGFKPA